MRDKLVKAITFCTSMELVSFPFSAQPARARRSPMERVRMRRWPTLGLTRSFLFASHVTRLSCVADLNNNRKLDRSSQTRAQRKRRWTLLPPSRSLSLSPSPHSTIRVAPPRSQLLLFTLHCNASSARLGARPAFVFLVFSSILRQQCKLFNFFYLIVRWTQSRAVQLQSLRISILELDDACLCRGQSKLLIPIVPFGPFITANRLFWVLQRNCADRAPRRRSRHGDPQRSHSSWTGRLQCCCLGSHRLHQLHILLHLQCILHRSCCACKQRRRTSLQVVFPRPSQPLSQRVRCEN